MNKVQDPDYVPESTTSSNSSSNPDVCVSDSSSFARTNTPPLKSTEKIMPPTKRKNGGVTKIYLRSKILFIDENENVFIKFR